MKTLFLSKNRVGILAIVIALLMWGAVWPTARAASFVDDAEIKLVQARGSSRIYAAARGYKYLLQTPSSLRSYRYKDKQVEIVEPQILESLPDVRLIRSSLGPRVYLLDRRSSQKLWFPTEASFSGSGEKWSQVFEISAEDSRSYANARLARAVDEPTVYYLDLDKQTKAPIPTPTTFLAKGFLWSRVVVAPPALLQGYTSTTPLDLTTPVEPEPSRAALSISAGTDIAAATFPASTIRNRVWTINLSAVNASVTLNSLKVTKRGFMSEREIDSISLLDEQGFLLASPQRFADSTVNFTLASPITVSPGQTKTLTLSVNFAPALSAGSKTFYLSILDAEAVSASAPARGNFPLTSATHTVLSAASVIGQLTVDSVEIFGSPRNVVVGTADQVLNRWRFSVAGGSEDVLLERVLFAQLGNGQVANFLQYELVDDQNRVVAKNAVIRGRSILIDFGKNPYRLRRGESKELALRADVVSGSNNSAQFIIQNDYDIFAKGATNNYYLAVLAGSSEMSFPVGDRSSSNFNAIFIEPGKVLVALNAQSPGGAITHGAREALLAAFDIRALGQTLRLEKVGLKVTTAAPHTALTESVTIRIKGGATIGTISSVSVMNQSQVVILSNPPTIKSGQTLTIEVVGNIDAAASIADRYTVELSSADFVAPGAADRVIFSAAVAGAERAVQEITLRVRRDPRFVPASTLPAGSRALKIGRYLFQPSAGERVKIEQVSLTAVGSTPVRFSDGYSNLKLSNKVIATPTGNPHIFALAAEVNAGSEVGFDLFVDTTTAADGQTVQLAVQEVIATGVTSKTRVPIQLEGATTPLITLRKSIFTISLNSDFSGGATARTAATIIGSFTLSVSGAEDIAVPEFTITETSSSSGLTVTRGYKNVRLLDAANGRGVARAVASPVAGAGGNLFTGGPTLKSGQTLDFNVVVDATGAATGDTIQLVLLTVKSTGRTTNLAPTITGLPVTGQIVTLE